jgi:3-oxoacyl-[acyl-carrier protein] reductase
MKLENSRILVTGGSLGIGKAAAQLLVKNGAKVGITGRDRGRLAKAAKETGAFPIVADVALPADVQRTCNVFLGEFGGMDCLVNNAGIGVHRSAEEVKLEDYLSVFGVNVFGAALMTAAVIPVFQEQGRGNIVNIGSTAGLKGYAGGSVYGASKFALRGMTQCWQAELRKYNIRVTLVNPSEVATAFGDPNREERTAPPNKLRSEEIAHAIKSVLEMDDRGLVPELTVWATNPW